MSTEHESHEPPNTNDISVSRCNKQANTEKSKSIDPICGCFFLFYVLIRLTIDIVIATASPVDETEAADSSTENQRRFHQTLLMYIQTLVGVTLCIAAVRVAVCLVRRGTAQHCTGASANNYCCNTEVCNQAMDILSSILQWILFGMDVEVTRLGLLVLNQCRKGRGSAYCQLVVIRLLVSPYLLSMVALAALLLIIIPWFCCVCVGPTCGLTGWRHPVVQQLLEMKKTSDDTALASDVEAAERPGHHEIPFVEMPDDTDSSSSE